MITSEGPDKSGGVFSASSYNDAYWDNYLETRAEYNRDFYDKILDYHKLHNKSLTKGVAHDVGTGPGQVALELSKYFDNVIASDNNETLLAAAAARIGKLNVKCNHIAWEAVAAEDLSSKHKPESAAIVTAAECLPLLDIPRAMSTFEHLLQPNGTLAAWFYGTPVFSEPDFAKTCQPILSEIYSMMFGVVVKNVGAEHMAAWKNVAQTLQSWLENVSLSPESWCDIQRHKWNSHLPMSFIWPQSDNSEPGTSVNDKGETVIVKHDPHFWAKSWDAQQVRFYLESLFPNFEKVMASGACAHIEPKFAELEKAMGGEGCKRDFMWPVILILATKK